MSAPLPTKRNVVQRHKQHKPGVHETGEGLDPDHNLLLTAGLREELLRLETTQLLWEIRDVQGVEGECEIGVWKRFGL